MPKRTASQRSGDRAETFVAKIVVDAGHLWHPRQKDFGIDGEIEAVGADGQLSGPTVLVQVKGSEPGFAGEDATSLRYMTDEKHIEYWLRAGRPVVLVCVNLATGEAWLKSINDWFSDPERRARRVVEFDKSTDRFDEDAVRRLAALQVPARHAPPLRLATAEILVTNLLEVTGFAPFIWIAETPCRRRDEAWELMRAAGAYESGFCLADGQLFSMVEPTGGALSVLCKGEPTQIDPASWAETEDPDILRRFVALLNFTLRSIHHRDIAWHPGKHVVYFQGTSDMSRRKIKGSGRRGRTVFAPYFGRDDANKVRFCRHLAADLRFRRWDGRWVLEINPTYHFTVDGRRDSLYEAEYLAKIKRLERNSSVLAHVKTWADYLRGESTLLSEPDERIRFGDLLRVQADAALDESVWIPTPPAPTTDSGLLNGLWETP